jgi:hypothetical protein
MIQYKQILTTLALLLTAVTGAWAQSADPEVTWNAATKTGSFTMPDCDVEIAPIYAPVAAFDLKEGSEDKQPAAVEGIFIESTDAIITAGSCAQGTLMYAVSTSATEAPALTAFSADLPTAKDITTAGDVYVWYYIKGADTPEGQEPTEKNTFNDSEICTTPLKVTLLNNKFNILFTAANTNTIEAGKATVTVGGTAATVTEGKLEGVKMESKTTITAKEGYKIKSVTVKKTGAEETVTVTINDAKTEASFDMPTNDVTVTYELIRDMTVAVSAKVGDGTDGCRFCIKKESGQYDLVDKAADDPEIMDNIDAKNPAEVAAKDYELQLQKLGDDGKTWTNTADYSPGTFRLMVTGKEGYDGTIYTNTYVLYEQTSITFAKGYSTHYYTESLVLDEKQDGLKFYAVTAVTDEKVTLTEIEAKAIPAETPFIAYNAGAEAITAKMGLLKADDVTTAEEFKGTAEDKTMAAQSGCYVLRNGDTTPTFRLVEGAGTLPAHRCWIELGTAAGTRSLGFDFSDGTTGMSEALRVKSEESAGDWYDLQGRKLQGAPLRKGAYIHNGKTIIIK